MATGNLPNFAEGVVQGVLAQAEQRRQRKNMILQAIMANPEAAMAAFSPQDINTVSTVSAVQRAIDTANQRRDIANRIALGETSADLAPGPITGENITGAFKARRADERTYTEGQETKKHGWDVEGQYRGAGLNLDPKYLKTALTAPGVDVVNDPASIYTRGLPLAVTVAKAEEDAQKYGDAFTQLTIDHPELKGMAIPKNQVEYDAVVKLIKPKTTKIVAKSYQPGSTNLFMQDQYGLLTPAGGASANYYYPGRGGGGGESNKQVLPEVGSLIDIGKPGWVASVDMDKNGTRYMNVFPYKMDAKTGKPVMKNGKIQPYMGTTADNSIVWITDEAFKTFSSDPDIRDEIVKRYGPKASYIPESVFKEKYRSWGNVTDKIARDVHKAGGSVPLYKIPVNVVAMGARVDPNGPWKSKTPSTKVHFSDVKRMQDNMKTFYLPASEDGGYGAGGPAKRQLGVPDEKVTKYLMDNSGLPTPPASMGTGGFKHGVKINSGKKK